MSLVCLAVTQTPYFVSYTNGANHPVAYVWVCINGSPPDTNDRCADGSQPTTLGKGNIPSVSSSVLTGQTQLLCEDGPKPGSNGKCPDGSQPIPIPYPIGGIGSSHTTRSTPLMCADGSKPDANGRCADGWFTAMILISEFLIL